MSGRKYVLVDSYTAMTQHYQLSQGEDSSSKRLVLKSQHKNL